MLLKGLVLEFIGRKEDALFYYNEAALEEPDNMAVYCHKKRLTALLDHDDKEVIRATEALKNPQVAPDPAMMKKTVQQFSPEPVNRSVRSGRSMKTLWNFLKRGRMTEAYYDLMKKCAEYPDSSILAFRKAEILRLMGRETEARAIFCSLREDNDLRERVSNTLLDLDYEIVGEKKEKEIPYDILPEIYFNTGNTEACRKAISEIKAEKMTAELLALKGRCEVIDGHFSDALKTFDEALSADPSVRGVRLMKGMLLQSKRDYKGALAMYDEALHRGEDPEDVSGIKAALLYEQERNAELLVFRSDVAKMKIRSYDVDGFVGLVYMERTPHDDKNGIDYLENAMSAGSQNEEFYIAAVRAYLIDDKLYAALSAVEAGIRALPDSKELFALKAEVLFHLKKYDAAELAAGTLLSEDPKDARSHYLLGKIQAEKGNEKDALRWLKSAAELDEKNHTYIYAYADMCFETGDRRSAEQYYTKAVQLNPRDYISLKRRAILLEQRGNDEDAISDVKKSLKIHPNDAEAYVILGNIVAMYDIEDVEYEEEDAPEAAADGGETAAAGTEEKTADPDAEETEGESAAENSPEAEIKTPETEDGSGKVTEEDAEKNEEEAEKRSVESDDRIAESREEEEKEEEFSESRGDSENLFQEDEAPWSYARRNSEDGEKGHEMLVSLIDEYSSNPEFYFYKAVSIDPAYRESYISLAKYQAENGKYDQAMKNIDRAISLNSEMTDGYMVKGIICHLKNDNDEAIRNFREVTYREPDNLRAYSYISKCCNAEGRYEEAVEAAERGLQINGGYANFFVNKGVALYHMRRYEEAVEALRRVITNQNAVHTAAVETAYRFRGMAYEKLGDAEKALSDYRKLCALIRTAEM